MFISPKERHDIIELAKWMKGRPQISEYHKGTKTYFRYSGLKMLKIISDALELPNDSYDIRYQKGGPGVSGDCVLHSENVYISFSEDLLGYGIMYRSCKGRKDYQGGPNRWITWSDLLADPDVEIMKIRALYTLTKREAELS